MNIKKFLGQVKAILGEPPVNVMSMDTIQHIQDEVKRITGFDIAFLDIRIANVQKNIGLVMPADTHAEKIVEAENILISAAREMGVTIARENIRHYVPDTSSPSPLIQRRPQVWFPPAPK